MSSTLWHRENWEQTPDLNEAELDKTTAGVMRKIFGWVSSKTNKEEMMQDVWTFPNLASDALASKVPPVVLVTGEFDFLRYATREARELY